MMTVPLNSLKYGLDLDPSGYVRGADDVDRASKKAGQGAAGLGDAVQKTDRKIVESTSSFERLRRQLDPVADSQAKVERGSRTLARALEREKITEEEHGRMLQALKERYDVVGRAAAEKAAKEAAAAATAARAEAQRATELAQSQQREQAELQNLRAKYDETFAAASRYNTALAEMARLETAGALAGQALVNAKRRLEQSLNPVNVALAKEKNEITQLLGQLEPARAAAERFARAEELLGKALAAGTISGAEHTRMLTRLKTQMGDTSDGIELAGHQVQNLGFQLQDAAVQLQMGTSPFTVLVQQAPQAIGAVGGVSNATKLLGSALRTIVSPAGLAVTAVVALAGAGAIVARRVAEINAELKATTQTLFSLNPQSGLNADTVRQSSFTIAAQRGTSRSDASAALDTAIRNRNIGGSLATQIGGVGQDLAAVLGIDPAEAASKLSEAFSKGAVGIKELDRELGFLTVEQAKNIRLMEEQGNRAGALATAMAALETRFGGATKNMKTEWGKAWDEMSKTFDQFLEKLATSDLSQKLAGWAASAARGWRNILGLDSDINADIVERNKELIQAQDQLRQMEDARAAKSAYVNDEMIERQARRVAELSKEVDALIERQQKIAGQTAFGGGPIVEPPRPGMTDDEKKALDEKNAALKKETEAMRGNQAERSIRLAGLGAEQAALAAGMTAEAAHEERLIAETRAREQLNVASNDQLEMMALETRQLLDLADAYDISKAAVVAQTAANEAETAAVTGQTQSQQALRQALLERGAAQALVNGAQSVQSLKEEVREQQALADAALQGAAAQEEAVRQNKVRVFSEELLSAAIKSGRKDMVDAAEEQIVNYGKLTIAAQKANRERAFRVDLASQREALAIQEAEFKMVGAMPGERAREIAILTAVNKLKLIGKDITTAEGREYIANAALLAEQGQQLQEINRVVGEATDNIVNAFVDMADDSKSAWQSLRDFAVRMLKEIAAQAVIRPIIQPIVASTVGSLMGSGGSAATVGTGTSMMQSAGQIGSLASGTGMMASWTGPGTMIGSAMGTTLIPGTATGAITQSGSLAAAYTAPTSAIAGSAGGLTVGSALGSFAGGAAVGGIVGSMVGNATQSKAIGAGSGALSGAAAGFMIGGPVGAAIGAIGGALMGALGTSGKPSNKEGNATFDLQSGRTRIGGQEGDKFSQENRDAAAASAGAYGQIAGMMGGYANRDVQGRVRVVMGDRDGISGSFGDAKFSWPKRNEDAIGDMTQWFVRQFADQLGADLPGEVRTAIERIDWNDVESALQDLNFAGTFRDTIQSLRGDFGLVNQVTEQTRAEVDTLTDGIQAFKSTTARLGLDINAAAEATKSYVEGLLGMREVAAPLNAAEAAVMQLQVRFTEMAPLLREVGISADEAGKALQRAVAALRDGFIKDLNAEFDSLRGADFINEIDTAFAVLEDRMRTAAALGGGSAEAMRNNHQAISNILSELSNEQLDEAAARFGGGVAEIARGLKKAAEEVAEAAEVFDVAGWLRDLNREGNELNNSGWINQIGDRFAELTERLGIAAREGVGAGESLRNNHLAMIRILSDLTDPQLAEAAALFGDGIAQIASSLLAGRKAAADAAAAQQAAETAVADAARRASERVDAAREAVQRAFQSEITTQQDLAKAAEETAANMTQFADSLREFRQGLLSGDLSPLSPEARYQQTRAAFEDVAGRAAAGDETAIGQLQQVSSDFLQASRGYFASSDTYVRDFEKVQQALIQAESSATTQASAAERTATAANAQVSLLQSQLNAALGTTSAVMTVEAAVRELTAAIVAQAALSNATGAGAGMVGGIDVIGSAYQQYLGRAPDQGGYANWQNQLNGGSTIGSVVTGIAGSDEAFVRSLYAGILGREPDAGSSNWARALQNGMSRAEVERLFKTTEEARSRGYAEGGLVTSGQWNRDSVNARLAGGEFVTRATSVNSQTLATLRRINSTGSVSNDNSVELRALRDETRRQTAALQDGFVRLLKLTERQTSDIADLRSAERRRAAS